MDGMEGMDGMDGMEGQKVGWGRGTVGLSRLYPIISGRRGAEVTKRGRNDCCVSDPQAGRDEFW